VAEPVRVRRLTDQEGQKLQQIVRRGNTSSVRYRRAMMLLASAGGNRVPVIAQLVAADEDTVRDVIHRFNEIGLACLDPRRAGGRPHQLSPDDEDFVIATATTRPAKLSQPFTRWSIRKLVAYLHRVHGRVIRIGREALRCLLAHRGVTFQRTKTWKESPDPDRDAKLDRIEHVLEHFPDRICAFDEFGPLGTQPTSDSGRAAYGHPERHPATYHRTHGVRYFHGCYSIGDDTLWGVNRRKKGAANTLAALKSIRAARPDGAPIYVIMDNLSAHKGPRSGSGRRSTGASCASPPPTRPGPIRSRPTSGRCVNSPSPTPTTATTRCRPGLCTPTCAGATPTPAIATCWPPSAVNALASAAKRASAGAGVLSPPIGVRSSSRGLHDDLFTLSVRFLEVGQVAVEQRLIHGDGVGAFHTAPYFEAVLQRRPVGLEVDQFPAATMAFNQRLVVVAGRATPEAVVHHHVAPGRHQLDQLLPLLAADLFLEPVERLNSQHQAGVALPQSLPDHLVDRQPGETASHQLHRVGGLARPRKTAHQHHRAHLLRHGARLDRPTRRTYAVRALAPRAPATIADRAEQQ